MHAISVSVSHERWAIAGRFAISRGAKTHADVVVVELDEGDARGRGECVPYGRYGETVAGVMAELQAMRAAIALGMSRAELQRAMRPGSARNALDCAFWDLDAKRSGRTVCELVGLPALRPVVTAFTISLDSPAAMAGAAAMAAARPLLKVKLGSEGVIERIRAVRAAAPCAELMVDANEAWDPASLVANLAACAEAGVTVVEQPLPAGEDDVLRGVARPISICADESAHDRASLPELVGKYDTINVKLDKTGGLTEALAVAAEAGRLGLGLMVGCMVSTSLSIAPALLVAQHAQLVDLDGPLLLASDRADGLVFDGSLVHPPARALWG